MLRCLLKPKSDDHVYVSYANVWTSPLRDAYSDNMTGQFVDLYLSRA